MIEFFRRRLLMADRAISATALQHIIHAMRHHLFWRAGMGG